MEAKVKDTLDRAWADFRKFTDVYPDWDDDRRKEPVPGSEPVPDDGEYRLPEAMCDDFELYFAWRQALEPDMAEQIPYTNDGEVWAAQALWELANEGMPLPEAYETYCEWVSSHGARPIPFSVAEMEM